MVIFSFARNKEKLGRNVGIFGRKGSKVKVRFKGSKCPRFKGSVHGGQLLPKLARLKTNRVHEIGLKPRCTGFKAWVSPST